MKNSRRKSNISVEWLRSFPNLGTLGDEEAQHVLNTLKTFANLTYKVYRKNHGR